MLHDVELFLCTLFVYIILHSATEEKKKSGNHSLFLKHWQYEHKVKKDIFIIMYFFPVRDSVYLIFICTPCVLRNFQFSKNFFKSIVINKNKNLYFTISTYFPSYSKVNISFFLFCTFKIYVTAPVLHRSSKIIC